MTSDEIKSQVSMRQIVEEYGIKVNRGHMCCCPFHGEKNPSMKIYKDSYHCFACGLSGDIFDFVKRINNFDGFKEAFVLLGGTYSYQSEDEKKMLQMKRNREKVERERKAKADADFKKEFSYCISLSRSAIKAVEPRTDDWCFFINELQKLLYFWECKYESNEEVNEIDVIRICRKIRQRIDAITRIDRRTVPI